MDRHPGRELVLGARPAGGRVHVQRRRVATTLAYQTVMMVL
jgi:hypothetical protein